MGKGSWIWLIIIIGIFLLISVIQNSWESVKDNPLQSSINTGKSIYDTTKEIIEPKELENLGKPICIENSDCDSLEKCLGNCTCLEGECFK